MKEKNKAAQEMAKLSHKKQFGGKTKEEVSKEMRRRSFVRWNKKGKKNG